jgi:hypothetical protein
MYRSKENTGIIKCTVKFSDGKRVTARVLDDSADGCLHPITYEGAVDRLHIKPKTGTAQELTFLFRRIAAMATGMLRVSRVSC